MQGDRARDTVNVALPRDLHKRLKQMAAERGWFIYGTVQAALNALGKLERRKVKAN